MRSRIQVITQFFIFVYSLFFIGRAIDNTISFTISLQHPSCTILDVRQ